MDSPCPRAVALCLVLVLAGCGGLGSDPGTTPTLTPVGVPPDTPAGVSADGVNADAVAATHDTVLRRTNYTVRVTERLTADGTVVRRANRTRQVMADARAYRLNRTERIDGFPSTSAGSDIGYWFDGNTTYERVSRGGAARYRLYPSGPPGPLLDPTSHVGIAGVVGAFDLRRTGETDGGPKFESVELSTPESLPTPNYVGTPRNGSLTLTLSRRGYVRSYRLAYDASSGAVPGTVRVVRTVEFREVGSTHVSPPDWVSSAAETRGASTG